MAGLDNSRYGAAATAAPVLTASARPRRRRVKVFSQVFFKKLARCGAALHGLKGVARTVGPAFPYFPKRGDGCPPLGVPQKPLPQGLREGNEHLREKSSVYAGLPRCSGEHLRVRPFSKMLM